MAIDLTKFKSGTEKSPRPFGAVSTERPKILNALKTDQALTAKEVIEATKIDKTVQKMKALLFSIAGDELIEKRFVGTEQYYILTQKGVAKRNEYNNPAAAKKA